MRKYERRGLEGVREMFHTLYTVKDCGFDTPCWIWNRKPRSTGYGGIGFKGKGHSEYAHRVSWMLHKSPIPPNMMVLHKCDVRRCVNPDHLFLGTAFDNAQDMIIKGRSRHSVGEECHNAVLNNNAVEIIRQQYASGKFTTSELSAMNHCSMSCIDSVVTGKTWIHCNGPILTKSPHSLRGKLSKNDVMEIQRLSKTKKQSEIASMFNVHQSHISRILSGDTWRNANA